MIQESNNFHQHDKKSYVIRVVKLYFISYIDTEQRVRRLQILHVFMGLMAPFFPIINIGN